MNESNGGDVHARNTLGDATIGVSVQAGAVHGDVHLHSAGSGWAAHPAATTPTVVPRQLPGSAPHFVNRAVEQDALTTLLNAAPQHDSSTQQAPSGQTAGTVLLGSVDGTAGV